MSLGDAVRVWMVARGLRPSDVADQIGGLRGHTTLYRILSGKTPDPRVSTLVTLCTVLRVSPDELLRQAGLLQDEAPIATSIDIELRQALRELRGLNEVDKRCCLTMLRSVIGLRPVRHGGSARCVAPQHGLEQRRVVPLPLLR